MAGQVSNGVPESVRITTLANGFRDEIRGASPLALRELEDASQAQLLPIHRELLLMMGEDMGPLTTGFVGEIGRAHV